MVRLLVLVALAGCYDPGSPAGRCEVTCSTSGACPSGMTCTDGLCYGDGDPICTPADFVRRETIAAGRNHVCAIDAERALACWGDNRIGQLGVVFDSNAEQRRATPLALDIPSHERWVAVAAGGDAACAIDIGGALLCWGDQAQLPLGGTEGSAAPTVVDPPAPGRWQTVTLGDRHGCAVFRPDTATTEFGGELYCWGDDSAGQLGLVGASAKPVSVPTRVDLALLVDVADWIEVGAADQATCARRQGGKTFCFGTGEVAGAPGTPDEAVAQPGNFFRISVGARHACGSNETGQIFCWGTGAALGSAGSFAQATRVDEQVLSSALTWSAIAAGDDLTCALATTGEVRCFGNAAFGQTGRRVDNEGFHLDREGTTVAFDQPLIDLAAGDDFACGVTADGWACWGNNRHGQLGRDLFGDQLRPIEVGAGKTWTAVSAGDTVTCGVAGDAYCWGANENRLLGAGRAAADSITPVARSATGNISSIAVAVDHACFAGANQAACWGLNDRLQLGAPASTVASDDPIVVADNGTPVELRDVVVGTKYSCGVDKAGNVACWGISGRLGIDPSVDTALPVNTNPAIAVTKVGDQLVGGENAICAVHDAGALSCWGTFFHPVDHAVQNVNLPLLIDMGDDVAAAGVSVASVAIGRGHICGHLGDRIKCWGDNMVGQSNPAITDDVVIEPEVTLSGNPDPVLAAGGTLTCLASGDGVVAVGPVCFGAIPELTFAAPTAQFIDFAKISIGTLHACGVTVGGALACWGRNDHNQLGAGLGFDPVPAPVR